MKSPPTNLGASVRRRLYNLHTAGQDDFQRLVTRYALERLLYRLNKSSHRERFVLKGAFLFLLWSHRLHRPTKDLDFLGHGDPSADLLIETFRSLCLIEVEPDGMVYLPESVQCREIREETEYGGLRVTLTAQLDTMTIPLQIDVGFGDVVTPAAVDAEFPSLLSFPPPHLRAYTRETVVAEKLEAMVTLGIGNSRMKDFYDLWTLGRTFTFEGAALASAIQATFARRGTPLPTQPPLALTSAFGEDAAKQMQWKAFRRRLADPAIPDLGVVIGFLAGFLQPLLDAVSRRQSFTAMWLPDGGWQIEK